MDTQNDSSTITEFDIIFEQIQKITTSALNPPMNAVEIDGIRALCEYVAEVSTPPVVVYSISQ